MSKRYPSDRRERALQLVREGRIGGVRPGAGRPRKQVAKTHPRPAAAAVAKAARDNSGLIAKVFLDTLADDSISDHQKVAAIRTWLTVEDRETDREREERQLAAEREPTDRDAMEEELTRLLGNPQVRAGLAELLAAAN